MNSLILLDCTFRDGGYYNQWDFDRDLVNKYLVAMSESPVTHVEFGFRFPAKKGFLGPLAYSTETFINTFEIPKNIELGVMLNSSDLISNPKSPSELMDEMFVDAKDSKLSLVRFASHFKDVEQTIEYAKALKNKGYIVGLNVMQAGFYDSQSLTDAAKSVYESKCADVLYFADSMGNMEDEEITRCYNAFRAGWLDMPIGLHSHNNMGQGLKNTMKAIELGATWLDSTVLGMGRGAGNTTTEDLLIELISKKMIQSNLSELNSLFDLVSNDFLPMKNEYNWGPSYLYRLAALNGVHPTYVQQMTSDERYSTTDIVRVIQDLESDEARSYSLDRLQSKLYMDTTHGVGDWSAKNLSGKDSALLIAGGPTIQKYLSPLERFIDRVKPFVVSTNYNQFLNPNFIDRYCACHPTRLFAEKLSFEKSGVEVIAPISNFSDKEKGHFSNVKTNNYGLFVEKNQFEASEFGCKISSASVLSYSLAALVAAGYKKILIAGLDGYKGNDSKNTNTRVELAEFKSKNPGVELIAITPTNFDMIQDSLFSPKFV